MNSNKQQMLEALEKLMQGLNDYEKFCSKERPKAKLWRTQRQKEGSHEKP